MRRREFLVDSSQVTLGLSALPFGARTPALHRASELHDQEPAKGLIVDLEREIERLMKDALVPGVSIALVKDGKIFWRRAFGVTSVLSKEPVTTDTVFEAASTSKPVFSYAVMKLRERGILDLDTPLTKYTSERFLNGDPRLDLITARHILSHTTGFPNFRSAEEPLAIHFAPGSQWSYSGEGYSYLQSVVTRLIGGRPNPNDCRNFEADVKVCAMEPSIDSYMKANVLLPFGMTASGYLWNESIEVHMAQGHDEKGKPTGSYRKPNGATLARYGMVGGLCTTPTDYAKFLVQVIDPKPSDGYRLSKRSIEEMLRPQIRRNPASSWALGWEINHTPTGDFIRHGGGNPGYACLVAGSVTHKTGYVIMTNCENTGYFGVIAKLISGDILSRFLGAKLREASE